MDRKGSGAMLLSILLLSLGAGLIAAWALLIFGPALEEPANPSTAALPLWIDLVSRFPAWVIRWAFPALGSLSLAAGLWSLFGASVPRRPLP